MSDMRCAYCGHMKVYPDDFPSLAFAECKDCVIADEVALAVSKGIKPGVWVWIIIGRKKTLTKVKRIDGVYIVVYVPGFHYIYYDRIHEVRKAKLFWMHPFRMVRWYIKHY